MSIDERDFKLNRSAIRVEEVGETVQCSCLQHRKVHHLSLYRKNGIKRGWGKMWDG